MMLVKGKTIKKDTVSSKFNSHFFAIDLIVVSLDIEKKNVE